MDKTPCVTVMNSYDYCHFEVCLPIEQGMNLDEINELRKDAQRLVDEAIHQYKIAKAARNYITFTKGEFDSISKEVKIIKENFPKSEWTPEQKATIKTLEDMEFKRNLAEKYDYEDDYDYGYL